MRVEPPSVRKILVIDDDLDTAQTLAVLLRHMGHEVGFAITGESGLQMAREMQPEFVILDLGMPGLNGYEVARRLREDLGLTTLRLIAITGMDGEEHRACTRSAGFELHLTKPVDPVPILKALA